MGFAGFAVFAGKQQRERLLCRRNPGELGKKTANNSCFRLPTGTTTNPGARAGEPGIYNIAELLIAIMACLWEIVNCRVAEQNSFTRYGPDRRGVACGSRCAQMP
jgi:hypothetical protein